MAVLPGLTIETLRVSVSASVGRPFGLAPPFAILDLACFISGFGLVFFLSNHQSVSPGARYAVGLVRWYGPGEALATPPSFCLPR